MIDEIHPSLLEVSDHEKGNTVHFSTDLHRTSRPSRLLVLLQKLIGTVRFAFFHMEKALAHAALLILGLDLHREELEVLVREV